MKIKNFVYSLLLTIPGIFGSCTSENPNIIYILADDLGYGDISCYNEKGKIETPSIDRLAEDGVRFTDAHTSSAVCTPTRYGIITGRYNWRSELKKGVLNGYSKALIHQERTTVAEFLQGNEYNTAFIGKWHLGWDWTAKDGDNNNVSAGNVDYSKPVKNGPDTHGFDYSYGFCGSLDMPPYVWVENGMPTMVPTKSTVDKGKQSFWREGPTSDDFVHDQILLDVTEKTVDYINKNSSSDNPFFVYLALPAPHTPILPTEKFKGKSGLDNPYGDFVIMVDAMVGKVMKALDENGISENTILIFTSDNGCSPRADFKQLETKGHDPSYVFRGHKADIFEGGHRVPFIVRWPQKVKHDVSDQLLCTTDLFATVADILDADYPDNVAEDSYSFLPALNIKSVAEPRKSIVHHSISGRFAYRKGDYKVNFCAGSGGWSFPRESFEGIDTMPQVQLYNLKEDVAEQTNLYEKYPDVIEGFRSDLTKIVLNGRSTEGIPQENDGPKEWDQLNWMK